MPRNMSFFMTQEQILNKTKTVTRRFAWWDLSPSTVIQPVLKVQGLKKGDKIVKLGGLIEVCSVRTEPLSFITQEDVIKEGFSNFNTKQFILMLIDHYKIKSDTPVNRIEFKYL